MNMMGSLRSHLMAELDLSAQAYGWLDSAYFYANLLFLFPAGIILDRVSTKKTALLTIGICILGTVLFAHATTLAWAVASRFLTGIGSAFCFLSCMRLASVWFHQSRLALITGLIMTLAFLGGTVAQAPLTLLIEAFGWRDALYLDAALGAIIFMLMFLGIRDYPRSQAALHERTKQQLQTIGFWKSLRRSYGNGQNWLSGICTNMMNLPVFLLGAIWGAGFLVQTQHLTAMQASTSTMMIFIGTLLGSPTLGWVSDKIKLRKLPILIGIISSFVLVILIIYVPNLSFMTYALLFLLLCLLISNNIIN
jgi:MFS family permease